MKLTGIWFDYILSRLRSDDVHHPSFFQVIIFAGASEHEIRFSPETQDYMKKLRIARHTFLAPSSDNHELAAGPHVLCSGMLSQVFRIYDDANGAFLLGVRPLVGNSLG